MFKRLRIGSGIAVVLFGLALQGSTASAQEQMSATQDPDQHQQMGQWRTMNSAYPRIQTRARCSYDVKVNGQWTSWWDFQIRSSYQATTDYVFQIEYGNFGTSQNTFGAPGLVTAKYEDIYSNGTELLGTCHSHPLPNSLFIKVKCAAPTGQELPCFKDSNGVQYPEAAASGSTTGPAGAKSVGNSAKPIKSRTIYLWCQASWENTSTTSQLFESSAPSPDTDDTRQSLADKFADRYANALFTIFPESNKRPANWSSDIPLKNLWMPACRIYDTKVEAISELNQYTGQWKPQNWPPATSTGADGVRRLN
jgi:hypothetical protein